MDNDYVEEAYPVEEVPSNGGGRKNNTPISLSDFGAIIPKSDIQYTPMELIKVQEDLTQKSNNLIDKIVEVYYKSDETDPQVQNYLNVLKTSEADSYKKLLFQNQATEHMIQSLLERLNSNGSMDNSLYKLLMEIIRESNVLTMQVSNYVRNLPQTFKTLKYELESQIDMVHVDKTTEMITEEVESNPDDFIKKPQRGMRQLLKMADEMQRENHERHSDALTDDSNIPTAEEVGIIADSVDEAELIKQMQQEMEQNEEE